MRFTHVPVVTAAVVAALTVACHGALPRPEQSGRSGSCSAQQVCSNCHGVTGVAVSPNFPNLAGQPEAYLVAQLNGFKGQGRRDPAIDMWGSLTSPTHRSRAWPLTTPPRNRRSCLSEGTAAEIDAGRTTS